MSDTGKILNAPPSSGAIANQPLMMRAQEVFMPFGGTQAVSEIFSVSAAPLRIMAFGLISGDAIDVIRVWLPPSNAERTPCGGLINTGGALEKPYRIGGKLVMLAQDNDEIVIDGKGHYRLLYRGNRRTDVQVISYEDPLVTINDTVRGIA